MTKERVTLTGGSGFIGQALIKQLIGCDIYRINRGDFYASDLKAELEKYNPSIIIHAGAYGNHSSQQDEMEIFEANIAKTFLLLQATKDIPYKAFINFGSSSEYGQKNGPMREVDVLEPTTLYGATKACGTMLARAMAIKYNKPIVTVRPFSVYGPGEADFRFIPTVCRSLIKDEEFPLDTQAVHDWIYIDDFIGGVLKVIDYADKLRGLWVNIGTGKQHTNQQVVDMLSVIADKTAKYQQKPLRPHDSSVWIAGNQVLKAMGWTPRTNLSTGLKKTHQYYEDLYGGK